MVRGDRGCDRQPEDAKPGVEVELPEGMFQSVVRL